MANFLKHPKSFMLVHHRIWEYKKDINIFTNKKIPLINNEFVKKYYSGDSRDKELVKELSNKEELTVLHPNPLELITEFCNTKKKILRINFKKSVSQRNFG